jgi:hypothetical protein
MPLFSFTTTAARWTQSFFRLQTRLIAAARLQTRLSFCGGNLRPIFRGSATPPRITDGDGEQVRAIAGKLTKKSFGFANWHVAENGCGWTNGRSSTFI